MKITIILPTYNGAHTLERAIQSVLSQSYTDWELLVIDDGSTDATRELMKKFEGPQIRYIAHSNNLGIQKTLNEGLSLANGKYIARIDVDDVWHNSTKLERQVSYLESHPGCVLVGTGVRIADEEGNIIEEYTLPETDKSIRGSILTRNCFIHSSVLFRHSAERYSESDDVRHAEDYELWLRLGLQGEFYNIPESMTTYTVSNSSITSKNRVVQARRVLCIAWQNRKNYPNSAIGIFIALTRYLGFVGVRIIPVPKKLLLWIQKLYRSD